MGHDKASEAAFALPSVLEVIEGTSDNVFLTDKRWNITYQNQRAIENIGRNVVGTNLWGAFPQARKTVAWIHLHEMAATRRPVDFEFYSLDMQAWRHIRAHPVEEGFLIFFQDISRRKAAEKALRESEELLRLALDASGDGAWDCNLVTGELTMSPRFLVRLGYPPEAGKTNLATALKLVHRDDWPKVQAAFLDHIEGRSPYYSCEHRIRTASGQWCWTLDRGRIAARDPATGAPTRVVGTASDVTEEKRIAAEAQATAELLSLAQTGAGAGIWDMNLETRTVKLCPRSREMHGFPPETPELVHDRDWEARLHPDDVAKTRGALEKAIRKNVSYSAEFRAARPDGGYNWILGIGKPVPGTSGEPSRFVGLNLDITEQKRTATEIRRMQGELIHLSRLSAMGAMASTLAHEINQPLTVIANYVRGIRHSLWRNAGRVEDDLAAALAGAEASAERAGEIIKRLRDHVAKGETERRPETLGRLVQEACGLALIGTATLGIEPSFELQDENACVLADRVQIQQVLVNLVRNAVEALEGVEEPRRLVISSRAANPDFVEISVADNGSGISDEVREKLFTPFVSTKEHGMGVGLSICRTIVEAHGGRIWADSLPDGGTVIRFTLETA